MSSGFSSSLRLPTALADRIAVTPSSFIPKMLARKFSSVGLMTVAGAVAREKRHAAPAQRGQHVGTGRVAKRRLERHLLAVGQPGHVVQPAAADDPYLRPHSVLSLVAKAQGHIGA